eukprot:2790328-Pyramimonas_sp.AAC.2
MIVRSVESALVQRLKWLEFLGWVLQLLVYTESTEYHCLPVVFDVIPNPYTDSAWWLQRYQSLQHVRGVQ